MSQLGSRLVRLSLGVAVSLTLASASPDAAAEARTWDFLTTGNGHGFQVFEVGKNKITTFLDHPYRYVRPGPVANGEGIGRRNLAFDLFFGLRAGSGSGWLSAPSAATVPSYVDQSNIILAPATVAGINAESYFFAPFGYEGNAVVALLKAPGATDGYVLLNFHMGGGSPTSPDASGETTRYVAASQAIVETGSGQGAMVYVPLGAIDHADCAGIFGKVGGDFADNPACPVGNDIVPGFQKKLGADGWMAVAIQYIDNPADADATAAALKAWGGARTPDKILSDAKTEFESWRKPPKAEVALCSDDEKKLWRQSETILRMGQVREPNIPGQRASNGMILASLPPGEWHSGWVRDGMFSVVALARMGHADEAKMALNFFLNATPVGKYKSYLKNPQDYRISVVRYFGTGEEEADYSGQSSPNVEIDGWGMMMWAARQYVEASGDTAWLSSATRQGTVYEALTGGVAAPLEANLESNGIVSADSGIWEVHQDNKRHFAFTTMSAARGFCDMAQLANKGGHAGDVAKYAALATKVKTAFLASFVDPQGALGGSTEGISNNKYYDGAVAEAFTWSLLPDYKGATATATLSMLNNLRVDSGGYKRNNDGLSSYDNNEWILVDLRISNSLRRAGQTAGADGVVATVVTKAAANFYLLPELYNAVPADGQIGKYTGSIPMVGYGGGAFVMTMLDRSGLGEPNDCGDGKGTTLAVVTCNGVSTTPGAPGSNPAGTDGGVGTPGNNGVPDTSQVPYVGACLCKLGHGALPTGAMALVLLPGLLVVRRVVRRRAKP